MTAVSARSAPTCQASLLQIAGMECGRRGPRGIMKRRSRGQRGHAAGMENWTRVGYFFRHSVVHTNYPGKKIQLGYLPDKRNCDIPHVLFVVFPPVCSFGGCKQRQIGAEPPGVRPGRSRRALAAWRAGTLGGGLNPN